MNDSTSWPDLNPLPVAEFTLSSGTLSYMNAAAQRLEPALRAWFEERRQNPRSGDVELRHGERVWRGVCQHLPTLDAARLYLHDDTARSQLLHQTQARVEERTQDLKREIEIRKAAEVQAQAASQAKSSFLANMSHELRTPLNAILGYTEMLQESTDDPEMSTDLTRVHQSAKHLLGLIGEVLDLAKIEAGNVDLAREDVMLDKLLDDAVAAAYPSFKHQGLGLRVQMRARPVLHTDPEKVRQIVLNLLSNAAKFTEHGHVALTTTETRGHVEIAVRDTGPGISKDHQRRIFEPFEQEHEHTTRDHGGTGLGLTICAQLARLLGGRLELVSVEGEGSTFSLFLPL